MRVVAGEDATDTYAWGPRSVAFHHRRTCGCVTHWTPIDPKRDRMGLNARLFEPDAIGGVPVHRSPGPP